MSDTPEQTPAHAAEAPEPEAVPRRVSREPITVSVGSSRWMAPLAVLLALLGVGLATWALMKAPTADNTAIAQQVGDPKANVCIAFQTVIKAVSLQSHSNLGSDPAAQQAVAANARLALLGGGGYLLGRIPVATPPELADAVRGFAGKLQDIGMNYLAGVPDADSEQASRLTDAEALSGKILGMCQ